MEVNLALATDSYKLNHWNQYPPGTEAVYSYLESREGAKFPYTVFFGLQYLLKEYLTGCGPRPYEIEEAANLSKAHFGADLFNDTGWYHIYYDHAGELPLLIKAVPEGTVVPTGEVMMTVENTCPECYWLTNAVESLLTHVWYPSTVATLSRATKQVMANMLDGNAETRDALPFMLHDFGYRGVSSHESAMIGGLGHLVNFKGTDTLPAMETGLEYYNADLGSLAFSVPATEHSVMTSLGKDGEMDVVDQLIDKYPSGILSVVADSFDIYNFVEQVCTRFKDRILARDGVFVVRPDSITDSHKTPEDLVAWILNRLYDAFGGELNSKGYITLDSHVRVLWGDGIDYAGITKILSKADAWQFSAENMVFGMGGGLLQKVNRDTQRFAFKSSAQKRNGVWYDICKITPSKSSKAGRFDDLPLVTVFENGKLMNEIDFDTVRANAELEVPIAV